MRDDRGRDAALQMAEQPAAAVRSEHDQARLVLVGGGDDALPCRCRFDGGATRPEPASTASDAPWAAVRSAARRTSMARSASKCPSSVGVNPDVDGLPHADDHRVSPGPAGSAACSIAYAASSEPS